MLEEPVSLWSLTPTSSDQVRQDGLVTQVEIDTVAAWLVRGTSVSPTLVMT